MCASRWRRSVVAIATAGLLGFGVAGCTSSDDPPEPAPLPTESPSSTETPGEAPPSMPPAADGASAQAAKAFARHYFDVINYAITTGDTDPVREFAAPQCQTCKAIARNIDKIYGEGGHIESKGWQIDTLRYLGKRGASKVIAIGAFLPMETVVAADRSIEKNEGGKQPMTMYVTRAEGKRVERLDLVT